MNTNTSSNSRIHRLVDQLRSSSLFESYSAAFLKATGLPLILEAADKESPNSIRSIPQLPNRFCQALNHRASGACNKCALLGHCLAPTDDESSSTETCFAGLTETTVPIRIGNRVVARLRTGHVFTTKPAEDQLDELLQSLKKQGLTKRQLDSLRKSWVETPHVDPDRYQGAASLLTLFASQLANLSNRIVLTEKHAEPIAITRAREFIRQRLEEPLSLGQVADHVNVSHYYFCKLFKQSTGMTFTEYVNRQRIEWAKKELVKPNSRITEIAYAVGYQSLSQFNRSFLKIVGESPTRYREHLQGELSPRAACA